MVFEWGPEGICRGLHLTTVAHYELDHLSQEDLHQQDQGEVDGDQGLVAHRAVTTASQLARCRSLGDDRDRHHLRETDLQGETLNTAHGAHHQDLATAQRHLWMTFRLCVHPFHETGLRAGTPRDLRHGNDRQLAQPASVRGSLASVSTSE
ncbi:hypothetical protein VC83_05324 [Pseudogymnoascus destructans]|nr:uncharacterized protein VC83_05324 [Pseudogymnoascus destructans]OAF58007.1 hypothetical protein VC83_05324 [Pseudogymnoascus destructans]